ncbi:hypothetical protein KAR91_79215 [Candidatus Pacearchaeota archaeon]|nr:hypothetical protein [Candidatus Pacearchaeota archaeon]
MGTVANVIMGKATLTVDFPYTDGLVGSITTDPGYTVEGVTLEYSPEFEGFTPDEETVEIKRALMKEAISISFACAESTLANLNVAMAGSDDGTAQTIKLGGGVLETGSVKIVGVSPDAGNPIRTIILHYCTAVESVGMPFKKGGVTQVPVTLSVMKHDDHADPCTIIDT